MYLLNNSYNKIEGRNCILRLKHDNRKEDSTAPKHFCSLLNNVWKCGAVGTYGTVGNRNVIHSGHKSTDESAEIKAIDYKLVNMVKWSWV